MNKMELAFSSKLENIKFARSSAIMFLHELDLTLAFVNEIKTIVSEAVTNAIIHGYKEQEGTVYFNMSYDDERIMMTIIDNGKGIKDINLARTPMYSTAKEEERSGLGFTIMEIFSDELEVFSKENEETKIKCLKYIKKGEESA